MDLLRAKVRKKNEIGGKMRFKNDVPLLLDGSFVPFGSSKK